MSESYEIQKTNKVRAKHRASYDHETVHAILDQALLVSVAFNGTDAPVIIPMIHARKGQTVYVHGAKATRFFKDLQQDVRVCINATIVDGIVVGRSAFHSSMNYRSVVAFGACRPVTEKAEHEEALVRITNKIIPNRWDEARAMTEKEQKATAVLAIDLDSASAKTRTGDPVDDEVDYDLPIWGGVIPVANMFGSPYGDARARADVPVPKAIADLAGQLAESPVGLTDKS